MKSNTGEGRHEKARLVHTEAEPQAEVQENEVWPEKKKKTDLAWMRI